MRSNPARSSCQAHARLARLLPVLLLAALLSVPGTGTAADEYDLVLANGHVIDPESGLNAVRHIGVTDGTIQVISFEPIAGRTVVDATGLVVAPGFIDLHAHGHDPEAYDLQVMDGVTTSFDLEFGTANVNTWYRERAGKTPVNFGVSIGHAPTRMLIMNDPGRRIPIGDAAHKRASEGDLSAISQHLAEGLQHGAVAVGLVIQMTPAASRWEVLEIFRAAAAFEALCYVHLRYQGAGEALGSTAALEEVIAAATLTGAAAHVAHLTSNGLADTPRLLYMIRQARAHGLDLTTEVYPYTAAIDPIESAVFEEGWQEGLGIDYGDLQWVPTGERLTAETFNRYRATGGMVLLHMIPEDIVRSTLLDPLSMVASDGIAGHPRAAGTFTRVLGRYTRDQDLLPLPEALRKMTLMPAKRLEKRVPAMRKKGRLSVGADADVTVFDRKRVIDTATYEEPARYAEGIRHVVVNGTLVVRDGKRVSRATPGKAVRAPVGRR